MTSTMRQTAMMSAAVPAATTLSPLTSQAHVHTFIHIGVAIAAAPGISKRSRDAATPTAGTIGAAKSVFGSVSRASILEAVSPKVFDCRRP